MGTEQMSAAAQRRARNRAAHYAERARNARTPIERATVAWDYWRSLIRDLPADQAGQWAESIATALEAHIARLAQILNLEGDPK